MGARALVAATAVLGCACSTTPTPFQGSIFNPAQIFSESTEVRGVRVNVLYGRNSSVEWLDVGSVNSVEERAGGLQLAGVANLAGRVDGIQIGGLFNEAEGRVRGLQACAPLNHADEIGGLQLASHNFSRAVAGAQIGSGNLAEDRLSGLQLAGIVNLAGTLDGLQIGGLHNQSGPATGVQIGGLVNKAEDLVGAQVGGLVNLAEAVVGFQLGGLFNKADRLVGLQIGLLNFNKGGLVPFLPLVNFGFGQ